MRGQMQVSLELKSRESGNGVRPSTIHEVIAVFDGHPNREAIYRMADQMNGIYLIDIVESDDSTHTTARFSLGCEHYFERLQRGLAWRFDLLNPTLPQGDLPQVAFVF